jgi:hypothetical protein
VAGKKGRDSEQTGIAGMDRISLTSFYPWEGVNEKSRASLEQPGQPASDKYVIMYQCYNLPKQKHVKRTFENHHF